MSDETEPNFEEALVQLERIVASLERGEPELTSALSSYEKGVQLLSVCHRLLEKAEQSVALLTGVDEQGRPLTAPFDASATMAQTQARLRRRLLSPPPTNPCPGALSGSSCAAAARHVSTSLATRMIRRFDRSRPRYSAAVLEMYDRATK